MSSKIRVDAAAECVVARYSGHITVSERFNFLRELIGLCRLTGYSRVVLDHRESTMPCSAADSFELGQELAKAWPRIIASVDVVVGPHEGRQGLNSNKLFALLCAANRGLSVTIHTDVESALHNPVEQWRPAHAVGASVNHLPLPGAAREVPELEATGLSRP